MKEDGKKAREETRGQSKSAKLAVKEDILQFLRLDVRKLQRYTKRTDDGEDQRRATPQVHKHEQVKRPVY